VNKRIRQLDLLVLGFDSQGKYHNHNEKTKDFRHTVSNLVRQRVVLQGKQQLIQENQQSLTGSP